MSKSKRSDFGREQEKIHLPKRKPHREKSKLQNILKNIQPDNLDSLDDIDLD